MKWEKSGEMFERGWGGFGRRKSYIGTEAERTARYVGRGMRVGGLVSSCIGRHFPTNGSSGPVCIPLRA